MKKSELKQIVKGVILESKGYSKYIKGGKTKGLTSDTLNKILLNIVNGVDNEDGDPDNGNKVLDRADPDNVDRILRGEKPKYK